MSYDIDPYLFYQYFNKFKKFVEQKSGSKLISFSSNPYLKITEGYKTEIHIEANKKLDVLSWQGEQIGSGEILKSVISAIEIDVNNLVPWQSRYGDDKRPHHIFYTADNSLISKLEQILFNLFNGIGSDKINFDSLIQIVGKKYSLLAYLFFLKDNSKYLPIAPKTFDESFSKLGVNFKTKQKCSWENYQRFNGLISKLRNLLLNEMNSEVSLLDAHSFAWVLSGHEEFDATSIQNVKEYQTLAKKKRKSLIEARIGQGQYRNELLDLWGCCSVTGCKSTQVLIASHIKPYAACDVYEAMDRFNGLLLIPNLDKLFDKGLITFDDDGRIIISDRLNEKDIETLSISGSMKTRFLKEENKKYLKYHRCEIFKS